MIISKPKAPFNHDAEKGGAGSLEFKLNFPQWL